MHLASPSATCWGTQHHGAFPGILFHRMFDLFDWDSCLGWTLFLLTCYFGHDKPVQHNAAAVFWLGVVIIEEYTHEPSRTAAYWDVALDYACPVLRGQYLGNVWDSRDALHFGHCIPVPTCAARAAIFNVCFTVLHNCVVYVFQPCV